MHNYRYSNVAAGEWHRQYPGGIISYIYRRQITVAANSDVSSQMAVKFSFDAQSLVAAGKLRTDLKDLRIVHYDGTKKYGN